ncbi:MaoC/PaaZ C-terminal domain-containing protein [Pseudomonas sp. RIT-PI-S]|uniref:MaoC family dehydratase n=1 Tax=Pseudomonas sp. RIT-PI-S TaxID=3035295 RepID=UPI0021D9A1AA|nr:MaoC/PaaZ C-terminal domain-containing protein [Pseudomonas sp. RIT-PI-S]
MTLAWQLLDTPPPVAALYSRAALRRNKVLGRLLPSQGLRAWLSPNPQKVKAYRALCGYADSPLLPPTYPHVMAFGLQLALLTDADFPLPLLGLVQLRNDIRTWRPLGGIARVCASVHVEQLQPHAQGATFTLVTRMDDALGPLWEERSLLLCRDLHLDGVPEPELVPNTLLPLEEVSHWPVPADVGRRYARVAGDLNPIHLGAMAARLFGFDQAIAPGMWTKARALAGLEGHLPAAPLDIRVAFDKPLPLPAEAVLSASVAGSSGQFRLAGRDGSTYLSGEWSPPGTAQTF